MKGLVKRLVTGPITRLAIRHGHLLILALGRTWSVRFVNREPVDRARFEQGNVQYAFSHGLILPLAFAHRHRDIQILISRSRDGEIISSIMERLGAGSVRGSSSGAGGRAVIEMISWARRGYDLAITPDGPRGPRGSVAAGTALIAARGGIAVLPLAAAASRAYRLRSWDRFLVPAPFSKVWIVYATPIRVAERPSAEELAEVNGSIKEAMAETEARAERYACGEEVPPECPARVPA